MARDGPPDDCARRCSAPFRPFKAPIRATHDGTLLYLRDTIQKGFDGIMLPRQAGIDRYVHNKLLEVFKEEYRRTGMVNVSRARINACIPTCATTPVHTG